MGCAVRNVDEPLDKEIFRDYWYRQKYVLYEIAKLAQFREMVFIDKEKKRLPVRCMFPYKADVLEDFFRVYKFVPHWGYNLYFSVAQFQNPPLFSFLPQERREQMDKWSGFEGNTPQYKEHLKGYDLFFDFDSAHEEDIRDAYMDAVRMKASLDKYSVPYTSTFSGSKGFHIRIPFFVLPQNLGWRIVDFCKMVGEMCSEKMKLKTLDIGVFDDRRVFKAPYSFDRGNICLPLTDEQIENFQISRMSAVYVLNHIKIFNRSILMRNTGFGIETERNHLLEWFRELKS